MIGLLIASPAGAVEFHDSIEEARANDGEERPVVVSFGAAWCGWCRKMEVNTFQSDEVAEIADKFLWVKIDVDEQQELAARFRVHGLPHTVVLDAKGRTIGTIGGYVPPERFVRFLSETLAHPQPAAQQVDDLIDQFEAAETDEQTRKIVMALVELLARPERDRRREVLAAFKRASSAVQPLLLELMSDGRLGVRAAAAHALRHCADAKPGESLPNFDPFADKLTRDSQLSDLRKSLVAW